MISYTLFLFLNFFFKKTYICLSEKNKERFTVEERILCLQEKIESDTPPSLENNAFKSQDSFWVT